MTFYRRPRVFISYRHQYYDEGPHAEHDGSHQAWVAKFAEDLRAWNVDVITDVRLRQLFAPYIAHPETAPFLAEASTICLYVAHIFTPIITWSYIKRISVIGDVLGKEFTQEGTVTREWNNATALIEAGILQLMLVQRQWAPGIADLHPLLNAKLRFDFRDRDIPYDEKMEILAEHMHMDVQVSRPHVDLPFAEWISMYVRWCFENDPSCRDMPLSDWTCDFERANRFLQYVGSLSAHSELPSAKQGSGRHDLDHLFSPQPDQLDLPLPRIGFSAPAQRGWWRRLLGGSGA